MDPRSCRELLLGPRKRKVGLPPQRRWAGGLQGPVPAPAPCSQQRWPGAGVPGEPSTGACQREVIQKARLPACSKAAISAGIPPSGTAVLALHHHLATPGGLRKRRGLATAEPAGASRDAVWEELMACVLDTWVLMGGQQEVLDATRMCYQGGGAR